MVARTVFLVTVFFFLEPIAAGAMSPTGIQRFKKTMGWIMAALFYKPAVGMLFWVAAKVANAGVDTGGTNHALLISIGIVLLSIFLPFPLVAICVPWVGNLGASSGGAGSAMNSIGSSIAGAVAPRAISVSGHAVKATAGAVGRTLSRSAKWLKGGSAEQNNPSGADPNAGGSGSGQFSEPTGGSGTGGGSSTKVVQTKTVSTGKQTAEVTKHATAGAKASAMPVATGGTARVAAGAAGGPIGVGVVAISTVASGTMNLVKSQTVRELNTMLPGGASGPGASSSSYQVPSGPVPRFDTGARGAKSTSVRGPERTAYQHQAPGAGPRKLY